MGKIKINQGRSVPWLFRLVGTAAVMFIIIKSMQELPEIPAIAISIAASFLLPLLWFSFKILTIDNDSMEIIKGVYAVGFKREKLKKFKSIDKIFINEVAKSRRSQPPKEVIYQAFIRFDSGEELLLTRHSDKEILNERVTKIRKKLGLKLDEV